MSNVVSRPEELTPDWLTGALRGSGELPAERAVVAVEQRVVGTGQMGDSIRLTLTYDGEVEAPGTVVAKLTAADETSRATGVAMRSYEKEVRFYQELAPHLPIRTPRCHYADIEVGTGAFVLLLEDLAPAEQGDQVHGCDADAAALVMREAARLHAPHLGDPAIERLEWLRASDGARLDQLAALMPGFWHGFRERYEHRLDRDTLDLGDRFIAHVRRYYEARRGPSAVVHGDFRLDNMLFGVAAGGAPVAVVDWQTASTGVPVADVAYFLGAGLSPADRRSAERDLLDAYLAEMAALDAPLDRDEAWLLYRAHSLSGLHMAIVASMIVERTARGDDMFLAMATRHAAQALDHDALAAVDDLTG